MKFEDLSLLNYRTRYHLHHLKNLKDFYLKMASELAKFLGSCMRFGSLHVPMLDINMIFQDWRNIDSSVLEDSMATKFLNKIEVVWYLYNLYLFDQKRNRTNQNFFKSQNKYGLFVIKSNSVALFASERNMESPNLDFFGLGLKNLFLMLMVYRMGLVG